MRCSARLRLVRWIANGLCLLATVTFVAFLLMNRVNPRWPALQCSGSELIAEPRLSHKFKGDTVGWMILVPAILLPPLQILLVELLLWRPRAPATHQQQDLDVDVDEEDEEIGRKYKCSAWMDRCSLKLKLVLKWSSDYIFGLLFTLIITEIGKSTVNIPRPYFLDSCGQPTFEEKDCVLGWVEEYNWGNPYGLSKTAYEDIHKSFPSGHSSCGMYMAVFAISYLYKRLNAKQFGSVVLLSLHTLWFGWGLFCGLSRIMDNRHHPIDVALGFLIGEAVAVFCVIALTGRFQLPRQSKAPDRTGLQAYVV